MPAAAQYEADITAVLNSALPLNKLIAELTTLVSNRVSQCSLMSKTQVCVCDAYQQNQWLHLVRVGSRIGLSKQMQHASSVQTASGFTAMLTVPTASGSSCDDGAASGQH